MLLGGFSSNGARITNRLIIASLFPAWFPITLTLMDRRWLVHYMFRKENSPCGDVTGKGSALVCCVRCCRDDVSECFIPMVLNDLASEHKLPQHVPAFALIRTTLRYWRLLPSMVSVSTISGLRQDQAVATEAICSHTDARTAVRKKVSRPPPTSKT